MPLMLVTSYDHRFHQLLVTVSCIPPDTDATDFISEDDLNTFEGYLRYQAVDPATCTPEEIASYRQLFDEAMAEKSETTKLGAMKLKMIPGEHCYAVTVREGSDLLLTAWVRRAPKGDVYVIIPRSDGDWDPHNSYHRDGTFHAKSFGHKFAVSKRQPLTSAFKGTNILACLRATAQRQ